ncbi:hypothetical protein L4D13_19030 [Photobacterium profundum]|uniref:hypothetical protein n=1 Tax=Photobacterium profundum TaxID=74109 RepID=UPI003D09AEDC
MHNKVNQWLDIAERVFNLIRPKAYNTIAKAVVFTGIGLLVESHFNFIHSLIVALFEEYIGKSEFLRSVLDTDTDKTIGIILITLGMLYHISMTLGKDYIDTKKAELPKFPSLSCLLLNGDKKELDSEFTIRGSLITLPNRESIPNNAQEIPEYNNTHMSAMIAAIQIQGFVSQKNRDLFRERAEILKQWSGAELLHLKIENNGSILANCVSVKLQIPRDKGVLINDLSINIPEDPKETIDHNDRFSGILDLHEHPMTLDDLSVHSDADFFTVYWRVNSLQAQTEKTANNYLLLKTNKSTVIECTIFCDELPEPIVSTYIVNPPPQTLNVTIEDLKDSERYIKLCDKCIMEGHEERAVKEWMREYEVENEES